ncbi:hypothetical protein DF186_22330, partial [Enterococcus hirae]
DRGRGAFGAEARLDAGDGTQQAGSEIGLQRLAGLARGQMKQPALQDQVPGARGVRRTAAQRDDEQPGRQEGMPSRHSPATS